MLFQSFRRKPQQSVAQRMISEHSTWLTWALGLDFQGFLGLPGLGLVRVWRGKRVERLPRIPVKKVSEGGFAGLMSTPAGRYRAERWWERALEQVDDSTSE